MARRGYSLLFAMGLFISDALAVCAGFISAFCLRFYLYKISVFIPEPSEIPSFISYSSALPITCLIMALCLWAGGLYKESLSFKKILRIGSIIKNIFYGAIILIALSALYREISFSRVFGILLFLLISFFVVSGRWILINLEYKIRKIQGKIRTILLVGDGIVIEKISKDFQSLDYPDHKLLGYVKIKGELSNNPSITCVGRIEEMEEILEKHQPDEIIFSTMNIDHGLLTEIITACDRRMIQFYIAPDVLNFLTSKVELTSVGGYNLIGIQKFPLDNGISRLMKRIFDILGALFGLIFFSWVFLILIILIKSTSKGSVFYFQERCREDGRSFMMIKFRTMDVNAEKVSGPVWAKADDERRTKIGKFIRALNLDEIPQLFNVLKGDMSLVGPRPERPHFISQFKFDIPRYMARHSIKPGVTGWAQVNGWRGNTSLEERIKYDIYYIENWSIWFDLKIIFLTFFSFKNAY